MAMFETPKTKNTDFIIAHCPYCHKSVDLRWNFATQGVDICCPFCGHSFLLNGNWKASKKQANNLATGTRLMMASGVSRDVAEEASDIADTQKVRVCSTKS